MSRQRLDDAAAFGFDIYNRLKIRALTLTLAAHLTVDADGPPVLNLDPGGAGRNVTLPTEDEGLVFFINNIADAAEDLTVKNPAASTLGTVSQNEMGVAFCLGGVWYLRLVGTTT
jgi:hypothetical protein